ncbi:MAG: sulfite exporter TauE/SafE family protein [Oscillospiraceae bacterium]|nr:sulfite exporter TauE/SafE family protein [Oscillospiraceae bacterium]
MFEFIICAIAGIGAGVATGFAGLSAAVYISPILVTFLGIPSYEAIGIALASDVLASGASSLTYYRHGNINIKKCIPLLVSVISFTIIGSIVGYFFSSSDFGDTTMTYWTVIVSLGLGFRFLLRPVDNGGGHVFSEKVRTVAAILLGAYTGFLCGFQGTGGGMMMLFILTMVLGYALKTAVGTSVFIMTFTALIGAISHFAINGMPGIRRLVICVIFTLIAAQISASLANKIRVSSCNLIIGVLLAVSGVIMLLINLSETGFVGIDTPMLVGIGLGAVAVILMILLFEIKRLKGKDGKE